MPKSAVKEYDKETDVLSDGNKGSDDEQEGQSEETG